MKRKVPKNNISSRIADIEEHQGREKHKARKIIFQDAIDGEAAKRFFGNGGNKNGGGDDEKEDGRNAVPPKKLSLKKFFAVFFGCVVLIVGWTGFRAYQKWNRMSALFSTAGERLERIAGSADYQRDSGAAGQKSFFGELDFEKIKILLGNAGDTYRNFQDISAAALDLADELDILENRLPDFLFKHRGKELIESIRKIKNDLTLIRETNKKLAAIHADLGNFFPGAADSRLSLESDSGRFGDFLDSLLRLLESPGERHILVLFENSSELRPGGGFLGSYAEVVLKEGSIQSMEVRDINDADREFDEKIVPPKPLQAIATRWRAADANWFFDYSLSSKKVIQFMEKSKKYRNSSITFDGAIAVSPNVVRDILEITGPVQLSGRSGAINKDNFLLEIQKEVQAGQAGSTNSRQAEKNAPKKILEELTPVLLDKLSNLQGDEKKIPFLKFGEWLAGKDLMLYFKEPGLENFFDFYNVSGKVFELPRNFNGDYLAVVNANIGGGKTDLFVKQKMFFKTQLNLDGTASDELTLLREHRGNTSDSWWYRAQNQNYLEVFTPPDATLLNFSGGWDRKIYPKVNYAKSGYAIDPAVAEIESKMKKDFNFPLVDVFRESGKNVFAAWVKTDSGKTSKITFDYKVRLFAPPADGQNYQFVFEKQAGSSGEYQFELYAPVGFRWRENKLPVFEYETDQPAGRIIFNLTLEKS